MWSSVSLSWWIGIFVVYLCLLNFHFARIFVFVFWFFVFCLSMWMLTTPHREFIEWCWMIIELALIALDIWYLIHHLIYIHDYVFHFILFHFHWIVFSFSSFSRHFYFPFSYLFEFSFRFQLCNKTDFEIHNQEKNIFYLWNDQKWKWWFASISVNTSIEKLKCATISKNSILNRP